ncbi:hypothetical protein LEN26_004255 [Aphanomyces euteiches]|nr:hypothetical protein AeMF1_002131 [Aphanomyces euteiches]KAH9149512.1 hypothetical protein LEN26_004255 [Aphanomyces euteiches]
MWMREKLMRNEEAFVENFRMSREVFIALRRELVENGDLRDSPMVSAIEQLGMFLYFVGHHSSSAELQERFQHSGHTVTRYLRVVLQALFKLSKRYIKIPSDTRPTPKFLLSPKFNPFFVNCRMAVDGTHIPVWVPQKEVAPYQGRKGITMNVLAACDFDMLFTYVLAGWEGSAADARVFTDALQNGYDISPNLFDIMDAGFALTTKSLTPYRSTRYHLKEFARGSLRP